MNVVKLEAAQPRTEIGRHDGDFDVDAAREIDVEPGPYEAGHGLGVCRCSGCSIKRVWNHGTYCLDVLQSAKNVEYK